MRRIGLAVAVGLCLLAGVNGADAQSRSRGSAAPRAGSSADDDNLPPSKPPPVDSLPPIRGISGPRLQPGAALCRSEADLQYRAEVARRRADGQPDAGNPMQNCMLIRQERGVEIIGRHGLGRTEVRLKPSGETGWTDAYIP